jgi:hypothetical protein
MRISTLNRWRQVYLAEAALAAAFAFWRGGIARAAQGTLVLGAALWLMHDLAHGRWRAATGDAAALAGSLAGNYLAVLAGALWAASKPERPPSPFIWSRDRAATRWRGEPRGTS